MLIFNKLYESHEYLGILDQIQDIRVLTEKLNNSTDVLFMENYDWNDLATKHS